MPFRLRRTRKLRGHVSHVSHMSHSHGPIGQHRKHQRAHSHAGGMRYHDDRYHPGYFGKAGMRQSHLERSQSFCLAVNLDRLWTLFREQTCVSAAKNKSRAASILDVVQLGYHRVLGKGKLPTQPVIVKAKVFSRRAEEKSKGVGVSWWLEATQR
ncbi:60S ribosomal protein L27a-like [Rattus rattus]|uniref:60S ribosomal protein L27a-like n=1 Tax=Rattus rattus TaxID=10117 RepID=UPI0013F2D2AC|nr:60S ribosomal protein L27a-like [Rattus rattus]